MLNKRKVPVFPAHAGMSQRMVASLLLAASFPRSRGDEPLPDLWASTNLEFSPLTRG